MKTIKLCIVIVLVVLVTFEISSRIWLQYLATPEQYQRYALYTEVYTKDYQWAPHHYLNYYPTPGYKKGLLSHNSMGYRGREFPLKKPDGVFRIAALGGSSTYDTKIEDNEKTFTAQLERVLKHRYGYKNVEVINAGVGGYDSWESLINLEFRVLDLDPDLVIVYPCSNDVHARLVIPSSYRGDNSGKRKQWRGPSILPWEHSCFLRVLIRKVGFVFNKPELTRQVGLENFVCSPTIKYAWSNQSDNKILEVLKKNPPVYFRRNLTNMVAITKEHNINIMFATWAYSSYFGDYTSTTQYRQGFKENNEVIKEIANNHKIPLFDFAAVMPKEKGYWFDGRHVNEKGAKKKAELFADFIHKNGLIAK